MAVAGVGSRLSGPPTTFAFSRAARSGIQLPFFTQLLDLQFGDLQLRGIESWRSLLYILSLDLANGSMIRLHSNLKSGDRFYSIGRLQ